MVNVYHYFWNLEQFYTFLIIIIITVISKIVIIFKLQLNHTVHLKLLLLHIIIARLRIASL